MSNLNIGLFIWVIMSILIGSYGLDQLLKFGWTDPKKYGTFITAFGGTNLLISVLTWAIVNSGRI